MIRSLLAMIIFSCSQFAMAYSYTMEIPEQAIQNKISAMMPMERKLLVFSIIISDPKVTLIKDTNKIGVFTNIAVLSRDNSRHTGRVSFTGTLVYNASQGAFFYHNPVIEKLEIDKLPEQYAADVKLITQLAVTNALASYPVYRLQTDDLRQKYIKSVLESVVVDDGKLLVTLKPF
ncbi:MAG: DUF1439 domain-containing protein [Gammaproteobacteria bacterium]|nr:DUF1439 domain-containing protein [Gammaproteobacteria bacterium]